MIHSARWVRGGRVLRARANIPDADPSTYDAPVVTVAEHSNAHHVELIVRVTSDSRWYVPWEAELDLADHVCASSLPTPLGADRATLTSLGGTRYLLRGTVSADTRFVSAETPRDFVFLRYNPGGQPWQAGSCG